MTLTVKNDAGDVWYRQSDNTVYVKKDGQPIQGTVDTLFDSANDVSNISGVTFMDGSDWTAVQWAVLNYKKSAAWKTSGNGLRIWDTNTSGVVYTTPASGTVRVWVGDISYTAAGYIELVENSPSLSQDNFVYSDGVRDSRYTSVYEGVSSGTDILFENTRDSGSHITFDYWLLFLPSSYSP